jgi:SPP1 family predicted phage head-tail adaptor
MLSPELRHRVTIESLTQTRDALGGVIETWSAVASDVPAKIEYISGREWVAANALQAETTVRITLRMCDLNPTMRINAYGRLYSIQAILPDRTGARVLVVVCTEGVKNG